MLILNYAPKIQSAKYIFIILSTVLFYWYLFMYFLLLCGEK